MPREFRPPRTAPRAVRLLIPALAAATAALACVPALAQSIAACESLRERIERNIRSNGVVDARVVVAERGNAPPGRVVGDCDGGRRVLVYRRDGVGTTTDASAAAAVPIARSPALATPAAAPRPATRPMPVITECADGSLPADGRCPPTRR